MFFTALTIALLILKATGYLNISWWLVFAPVLLALLIAAGFAIAFVFISKK